MPDPRVARTRLHVLTVARELLSQQDGIPLTFTRLAEAARVSRRTLYVYWGTVERVISDAVTLEHSEEDFDPEGMSVRGRLEYFLNGVRDGIGHPVTRVALASLIAQAGMDAKSSQPLQEMAESRRQQLEQLVGPISAEDYASLVGPLFYEEFIAARTAPDELLTRQVELGLAIIAARDAASA